MTWPYVFGAAGLLAAIFVAVRSARRKPLQVSPGIMPKEEMPRRPDLQMVNSRLGQIADAIATAEGYGVPGAIPTLANNPGDLTGDRGFGVIGPEKIARFPTPEAGRNALLRQLELMYTGRSRAYSADDTFAEIGAKWAPGPQSVNWTGNVASRLRISPGLTLRQFVES